MPNSAISLVVQGVYAMKAILLTEKACKELTLVIRGARRQTEKERVYLRWLLAKFETKSSAGVSAKPARQSKKTRRS